MHMIYKLLLICMMLKNAPVKRKGTPHDYPKMILTQLLVLGYWQRTNFVGFQMMKERISIINEELGETLFSLLGCCTSTHVTSDFEHMQKQFALLGIYRDVRYDVLTDSGGRNTSITWRHSIKKDGAEVTAVGFFFNRLISQVLHNTFRSYEPNGLYRNARLAQDNSHSDFMPIVFDMNITDKLPDMYTKIRKGVCTNFLNDHKDIWPESKNQHSSEDEMDRECSYSDEQADIQHVQDGRYGADISSCTDGCYAVCRVEFPDGNTGITVSKVIHREAKVNVEDGFEVLYMTAREQRCTVSNTRRSCIENGIWHEPANSQQKETIKSWSVLCYFPALTTSKRLPATAVATIISECEERSIFSHD